MAETEATLKFRADISNLKSGIQEANNQIALANSEYKALSSSMDFTADSADGLQAKINTLNKIRDAENKKLENLKNQYKLTAAQYGENSNAAQKLLTQVNKQQAAVNKTEKDLKEYEEALKNVGDATKDVGDKTKDAESKTSSFGNGLSKLGGSVGKVAAAGIAAVGAAAAAAVASFLTLAESTREYRQDMAQLALNADEAGVSLDNIKNKAAEVGAVTGEADAALEGLNMLMATGLDDSGINAAADALQGAALKFDGLKFEGMAEGLQESLAVGAAVGPFAEMIERNGDSLESFNAGLAACTTEAEKQQYTLNYLAKSGLAETSAAYKEQNKELVDAAMAQQKLTDAQANLGAASEKISNILKSKLADVLIALTPLITKVADAFTKMFSGDFSSGLSDITGILEDVTNKAGPLLTSVVDKVSELLPTILPMIANLITGIVTKVGELLPTLLPQLVNLIAQIINQIVELAPSLLDAAISFFLSIADAIGPTITAILDALPGILDSVLNALTQMIPALLDGAIKFFNKIVDAIPVIIEKLVEVLPGILNSISDFLLKNMPVLLEKAINFLMSIIKAIPTIVASLAENLPKIIGTIANWFISNLPKMLAMAKDLFLQIVKAIPGIISSLVSALGSIWTSISNYFGGLGDKFKEIGSNMIKGIWNGIKSVKDWIFDKIRSFVDDTIVGGIKDLLGIHSPSRVFAEIGKYSALGYGVGFEGAIKKVKKGINNSMVFSANGSSNSGSNSSVTAAAPVTNNFNWYSTAENNRFKIYQDTKAALALAGSKK